MVRIKSFATLLSFLLMLTMLSPMTAVAQEPGGDLECLTEMYDDFSGDVLHPRWSENVREDPELYSIGHGHLTVLTSQTDIHQTNNADTPNILLQPIPNPTEPWEATLKLSIEITRGWQQAGLILYGDDDNYAKMVLQGRQTAGQNPAPQNRVFQFLRETNAVAVETNTAQLGADYPTTVWVRLTSDGTNLNASYSADGENFTAINATGQLASIENPRIGLFAVVGLPSGNQPRPIIEANFEEFVFEPDSCIEEPVDECADVGLPAEQISVQFWTLNQAQINNVNNLTTVLNNLQSFGYRAVEPYSQPYSWITAGAFRDLAAERGIRVVSSHGNQNVNNHPNNVAYAVELGQEHIGAGSPPGNFNNFNNTMTMANTLNTLGQIAVNGGIETGHFVHNHQNEFLTTHVDPNDGQTKTVWELLMEYTDPELVSFQLDVWWAAVGQHDPAEVIEQYGDRIHSLHVKDGNLGPNNQTFLGEGSLDFKEILETALANDVQYFHVERDPPGGTNLANSYAFVEHAFEFLNCIELDPPADECADLGLPAEQISVQLWTLNQASINNVNNLTSVLNNLQSFGYRAIEPFGQPYNWISASDFRELAADRGIRVVSSHGNQNVNNHPNNVAYAVELGQEHIGAGSPPGNFNTFNNTMTMANTLNALGQIAVDGGIETGHFVHNHQNEFLTTHVDPNDGQTKTVWQLLMEYTDPELVSFQLDVWWAAVGQHDPAEVIEQYGDRINTLHIKDGILGPNNQTFLGEGDLDFKEILETALANDVQYFHVERDPPGGTNLANSYAFVEAGFEFLNCIELDPPVDPEPELELELTATTRCVAGNVFVTLTARNDNEVPVNVTYDSAFGSRSFVGVAPARFASHAFNTRASSVDGGSVTVGASAVVDGEEVTFDGVVNFDGTSC